MKGKKTTVVVSVFFALLISMVVQQVENTLLLKQYDGNRQGIYPQNLVGVHQLIQDDNGYRSTGNDPQMSFEIQTQDVDVVEIKFKNKVETDMAIVVYYAKDTSFSQDRCVGTKINKGENIAYIELPPDKYNRLRIDIGTKESQTYTLSGINLLTNINVQKLHIVGFLIAFFALYNVLDKYRRHVLAEGWRIYTLYVLGSMGVIYTMIFLKQGVSFDSIYKGGILSVALVMIVEELYFVRNSKKVISGEEKYDV